MGTMLEAGKKHNLKVIAPGHHRRIEAGLLSYGQDIDIETNPFECGQGWQVDLTKESFIGKNALAEIKKNGVTHKIAGLRMGGDPITWYASDLSCVPRRAARWLREFSLVLTDTKLKHRFSYAANRLDQNRYAARGGVAQV